jgi:hypothetical protein
LPDVIMGTASAEDAALFRTLWQDRVRRILVDHGDDPQLVEVRPVRAAVSGTD